MSEYKNQHYIPQVYLNAWTDKSGKIFVYNKNDNTLDKHVSPKTIMYKKDFYTKKANDNLILSKEEREEMFSFLEKYDISYNVDNEEKKLSNTEDFAKYYFDFDNWVINNSEGNCVKKKQIKDFLNKKRNVDLEKGWHFIEDNWRSLLNNIEMKVKENKEIEEEEVKSLKEFIIVQLNRTPSKIELLKDLIEDILGGVKEVFGEEFQSMKNEFAEAYFKKEMEKFQNGKGGMINYQKSFIENTNVIFYKNTQREFITSDNPAMFFKDDNFLKGKYNGIYFPISPRILVRIYKKNKYESEVKYMESNVIRKVNNKMKENSIKYYFKNK